VPKKKQEEQERIGSREWHKIYDQLTETDRKLLDSETAAALNALTVGSKFAVISHLSTVRGILKKDEWGEYIRAYGFHGLPKSTAYGLIDGYEEAKKECHPVFLAALASTGMSLNISPSAKAPFGKYTEIVRKYKDEINPAAEVSEEKAAEIVLAVVRDKPPKKAAKTFIVQELEAANALLKTAKAIKKKKMGLSGDDSPSSADVRDELTDIINHLLFIAGFGNDECEFAPIDLVSTEPPESAVEEEEEPQVEASEVNIETAIPPRVEHISEGARQQLEQSKRPRKTA